jgi:hypothetical protein
LNLRMRRKCALRADFALAIYRTARIAVVAAALLVAWSLGAAQACPQNKSESFPAVHKIERSVHHKLGTTPALIQRIANAQRLYSDPSCAFHTHGAACGSGCCFVGFASIDKLAADLYFPVSSVRILPSDQAEVPAGRPPPDFRPPRNFI